MANNNWLFNSLLIKFLLTPLKLLFVLVLVILVIFTSSIIVQMYFQKGNLLEEELSISQNIETASVINLLDSKINYSTVNINVARYSYSILYGIFFDLTQIDRSLNAQSDSDFGFGLKQRFLLPHYDSILRFDDSLKIISLRIGNITLYLYFAIILIIIAVIDGLMQRKIRQKNVSRESAGIYHRAKYWRTGIIWSSIFIYLCLPICVSPNWLLLPIMFTSILIFIQIKYLKKYL